MSFSGLKSAVSAVAAFIACAGALGANLDDKGFVRDWLISGPYPNYLRADGTTSGYDTDFLADCGGESYAFPREGDVRKAEFVADKSKLIAGIGSVNEWGRKETMTLDATWRAHSFREGLIDADALFSGVKDYFALYAVCYFIAPEARDARIAVGSDDFHKVWFNGRQIGSRKTSQAVHPGNFSYAVKLRKGRNMLLFKLVEVTQGSGFCVQILDGDGKPVPGIEIGNTLSKEEINAFARELHPPRPADVVKRENAGLEEKIAELKKTRLPALAKRKADLERKKKTARKALEKSFASAEARFAAERNRNLKGAAKSIDEPLAGAGTRRKLCLNGIWKGSLDGGKTWLDVQLPSITCGYYFVPWHFPLRNSDPKNHWSRHVPFPGWEGLTMNPLLLCDSFKKKTPLYRRTFEWDGEGGVDFVSECIKGKAKVFCNGKYCGEYDGNIGIVRIPLSGLKRGANELTIEYGVLRMGEFVSDGFLGDLFVEYLPECRVENVEIKTSWRKARIDAKAEVLNRTSKPVEIELRVKVVEGNRVRLRLPAVRATLAAGETKTLSSGSKWANPKMWGIGGKYGNPDLYELVTDVYCGGEFVDRHRETFGFREFWIFHTDFFLNGKRIVLQGDTGHTPFEHKRVREIAWNAYREDGINIVRTHDGAYWSVPAVADADRMGMLMYVQMYPMLHQDRKPDKKNFIPAEEWVKRDEHKWNLANYERWWKTFRNHPSVVIWSTDNEVLTQAWDSAADAEFNVRNEKVAALYEKYVKSLDPTCVMTRNGDLSTQNRKQRWFENPPCDTANYHYPEFNIERQIANWRKTYEWRPLIVGETLYCSYGQWDGWPGPVPAQVEKKAERVRRVVSAYREEEVPCAIYMGIGMDAYAVEDDSGKGNPYGITKTEKQRHAKDGTLPNGFAADEYPWYRLPWPSVSGRGMRPAGQRRDWWFYTCELINAFDVRFPAVTRNAVSKAYRETLLPQPPLRRGTDAEAIVIGVRPGSDVWAKRSDGFVTGVRADNEGRAWFTDMEPGEYVFSTAGVERKVVLKPRGANVLKPGFDGIQEVKLELPPDPGTVPAQMKPGSLAAKELAVGVCLFRDRSFCLKELPPELKGAAFLQGPFADAPSARAVVASDGIATVLSPQSGPVSQAKLLRGQGFEIDETIPPFQAWGNFGCDKARVWRKQAKKGEEIVFGKWAIVCAFDASNMRVDRPTEKNRALTARLLKKYSLQEAMDINATSPDYAVFIPPEPGRRQQRVKAATHDTYNDHFHVMRDEKRKCLYAFWTQATLEPKPDHHIVFRKSNDGGHTWSDLRILGGTLSTNAADQAKQPAASWQQAMLSKSGRLYVVWSRSTDHRMEGRYSDDGGDTWSEPEIADFDPRTPREVSVKAGRAEWWCNWQRPLRLGPDGNYLVGSSRSSDGVEFWEFANIDENPAIKDLKINVHNTGDKALKVPKDQFRKSICEEPSIVKLPDGRLFAVMRASGGAAVWSQSRDLGRTWTKPEQLRTKDGGDLIRHSVSPCPVYDWKGCEAGSGVYFGLFHLEVTDHRGPLYLVPGYYNAEAHQPVEFTGEPKLFIPRSHWNSLYSSYTIDPVTGTGTLWYPDAAKYYLLGRDITEDFIGAPKSDDETHGWAFGKIGEEEKFLGREPRFAKAFEFMRRKDLASLPAGRYEIDGDDVFALIQECDLRDWAKERIVEAHRDYIDIQAPLTGDETYGYGFLTEDNYNRDFDKEKDIGFYNQPVAKRNLKPGEFAIFFPPYGAHAPCCRDGGAPRKIKKLVIKIRKTGETLYNGIKLPGVWPPKINLKNRKAMEVPYLEKKNIPKTIPIDVGRQLFVDDFLIEEMKGTERIWGKPVKFEGNPVLKPETEIEIHRPGNSVALPKGGGMWWDEKRKVFRLWYETGWCYRIAYAESKDGIHWERPALDIVKGTNRLLPDLKVDSWNVFLDPHTDNPEERWKLMNSRGGHMRAMDLFTSADGIHWTSRGVAGVAGDRTTMFYNPFRKVWAFSLRGTPPWPGGYGGRNRSYFETRDFAGGSRWTWNEETSPRNAVQWMQADETDVTYSDLNRRPSLYNFDAVAYESLMLGFREVHHGPENDICAKRGLPKITDLVFAYSRDGFHFSCPDRTPAIASERWGAYGKKWDVGYVQPLGNICVVMGDELWFYYGAFGGDTTRLEPDRNNNCYYNGMYDRGCMGLAKMRRDGFAGLRGGVTTTHPVTFSGTRLFANLNSGSGKLKVEVLDAETMKMLETFEPVGGDSVKKEIGDVSRYAGKRVRFRFSMSGNAIIYSFWVSPTSRGNSRGYLAGGGPGYTGIIDE